MISQLYVGIDPDLYWSKWVQIEDHGINNRAHQNVYFSWKILFFFSFKNVLILISGYSNVTHNVSVYLTKSRGFNLGELNVKKCIFKILKVYFYILKSVYCISLFFLLFIYFYYFLCYCRFLISWSSNNSHRVLLNVLNAACTEARFTSGTCHGTKRETITGKQFRGSFGKMGVFGFLKYSSYEVLWQLTRIRLKLFSGKTSQQS